MAEIKRLLVNQHERLTDAELRAVAEKEGARVCPKVRMADVLVVLRSPGQQREVRVRFARRNSGFGARGPLRSGPDLQPVRH